MVIAYDRCSYVNPLFMFKFLYLSFIIFREKCAWQRYILSLRDLEAKLRSEIVWNYCEAREFLLRLPSLAKFFSLHSNLVYKDIFKGIVNI